MAQTTAATAAAATTTDANDDAGHYDIVSTTCRRNQCHIRGRTATISNV
jgi:hypothetical protein